MRRSSNADVEYFRRTVVLDPSHVEAHLQLAAYALVHRRYREVEEHLAAVRRVDRHTATVARIERILRQRR